MRGVSSLGLKRVIERCMGRGKKEKTFLQKHEIV
jgi:hypothetical protein